MCPSTLRPHQYAQDCVPIRFDRNKRWVWDGSFVRSLPPINRREAVERLPVPLWHNLCLHVVSWYVHEASGCVSVTWGQHLLSRRQACPGWNVQIHLRHPANRVDRIRSSHNWPPILSSSPYGKHCAVRKDAWGWRLRIFRLQKLFLLSTKVFSLLPVVAPRSSSVLICLNLQQKPLWGRWMPIVNHLYALLYPPR